MSPATIGEKKHTRYLSSVTCSVIGGSTGENVLIGVGQLFGEVDPSVPGRKNNLQEVV